MKVLAEEKFKLVAERNGWSLEYAKGNLEGVAMQHSGKPLSTYTLVGIDDYARGFRAGYFERQNAVPQRTEDSRNPDWARKNMRSTHVEVTTDSTGYLQNVAR